MPELRWTLLILGALFIGGLALWEWRRQRHARGPDSVPGAHAGAGGREGGERISPTFDGGADVSFGDGATSLAPSRGVFREPTLTFPEVSLEMPADSRDRFADPPVVELDDESLDRLKVEAGEAIDEFSEPPEAGEAVDDFAESIEKPAAPEPMIPRLSPAVVAPTLAAADGRGAHPRRLDPHDEPTAHFDATEAGRESAPTHEPMSAQEAAFAEVFLAEEPAAAAPLNLDALKVVEPIVEWPDEAARKIVALRLVSGVGERFAGRAVRLALAAEGFVLGKFDIFHKPGPDARAVLSAASLTKPGTFSLATMDAQRFGGISLFAVLPGPLSPAATFDELLITARALNDRLRGALQDERGEPLTPMRSANIRDSLTAAASAAAPVVGAAHSPPVVDSPDSATPA